MLLKTLNRLERGVLYSLPHTGSMAIMHPDSFVDVGAI